MFTLLVPLLGFIGIDDALILGGLVAGSAGLSSWLGNKNSKKQLKREAEANYAYSLRMAKNGPSASVEGLRKAGLNPILAATDGSFATPSMPSVSGGDVKSDVDIGGALGTVMQMKQTDSNIELQKSTSELNDANSKLAGIKAANELANRGLSGNWGALSRVLSEFGFDSKTVSAVLPSFAKGTSTPNGSVRPEGAVKVDHVAGVDDDPLSEFGLISDYENEPVKEKPFKEMSSEEKAKEAYRRRHEEFLRRQRKKIDESRERKRKRDRDRGIIDYD